MAVSLHVKKVIKRQLSLIYYVNRNRLPGASASWLGDSAPLGRCSEGGVGLVARRNTFSRLNGNPNLEPARAGLRIELLAVALELRTLSRLQPGFWQALVPDCVERPPHGRDMVRLPEHCVLLGRNPDAAPILRDPAEVRYLDTRDVLRIAGVIAVANYAIGGAADLSLDVPKVWPETLPLRRDVRAGLRCVALAQPSDQHRFALFETRRGEMSQHTLVHSDCLHEFEIVGVSLSANRLRRYSEMIAKRTCERFVRAVSGIQRE